MTLPVLIGYGVAGYVAAGLCAAVAFAAMGADRVLAHPASFTFGARLLLVPGALALWPYVLARWLKAGRP